MTSTFVSRALIPILVCLVGYTGATTAQTAIKDPFRVATKESVQAASLAAAQSARFSALREFALTKGIAEGRQQRFLEIHKYFEVNKRVLDAIYQVDHLYMQPRKLKTTKDFAGRESSRLEDDTAFNGFLIQPPIILIGNDPMQIANGGQKMEKASVRYAIAANTQFVSGPLYWQTYLVAPEDLLSQSPPDDPLLQPRDEAERAMMFQFYQVGYNEGRAQATSEVETRTKTLTTMVGGMTYGRALMDKGILAEPMVSTQYVPVAGNKTLLTLNTNAATISVPAGFELDSSKYKAIVHQANPFAK